VLLFPQMKPEKRAPKDPAEKYVALGFEEALVPVLQKAGYNVAESLKDQNPQKVQQQIGDVLKKYKLEIRKPSVDEIAECLARLAD